jgi:hypothetical protein
MGAAGAVAGKLRALAKRIGSRLAAVGRRIARGAAKVGRGLRAGARRTVTAAAAAGSRVARGVGELRAGARRGFERLTGRLDLKTKPPGHEFASAKNFTIIERDGSKVVRHGPINPGPLEAEVGETFRSASYSARTTARPIDLYRVYSDPDRMLGPYWSRTPPSGPLQATIDSALLPEYGNEATRVIRIQVPSGETIFEGYAARQRLRLGGGSQVYLLRVDPSWEVK